MSFTQNLTWLRNGEVVSGSPDQSLPIGVMNRPLLELLNNDKYLLEQIEAGFKGFAINSGVTTGLTLGIKGGLIGLGKFWHEIPDLTLTLPNNSTVLVLVEAGYFNNSGAPASSFPNNKHMVFYTDMNDPTVGPFASRDGHSAEPLYIVQTVNNQITSIRDVRQAFRAYPVTGMFKNKLINGDFSVWQRHPYPETPITVNSALFPQILGAGAYVGPDRWKIRTGAGTELEITKKQFDNVGNPQVQNPTGLPYGRPQFYLEIEVTVAGAAGTYVVLEQAIENNRVLAGRARTWSLLAKSPDPNKTMTVFLSEKFGAGQSNTVGVKTFNLGSEWGFNWGTDTNLNVRDANQVRYINEQDYDGLSLNIRVPGDQTGIYHVALTQVEESPFPTRFEERHIQQELDLCYRYYETNYDSAYGPGFDCQFDPATCSALFEAGQWLTRDVAASPLSSLPSVNTRFMVRKRAIPTLEWWSLDGTIGKITVVLSSYDRQVVNTFNQTETQTGFPEILVDGLNPSGTEVVSLGFWTADAEI